MLSLQKTQGRQLPLPQELASHIGHGEDLAQPAALAHEHVVDVVAAAGQALEVAAALGQDHVGVIHGVLEGVAEVAQLGAGDGGAVVEDGHQAVHPHVGGVFPVASLSVFSPRTQ